MYLTKFKFSLQDRCMQRGFSDCQYMHRFITGLFGTDRKTSDILYRIKMGTTENAIYLYSNRPVDKTRIPQKMLQFVGERDITSWVNSIECGQVKRFDLLAFPTKKVPSENSKHSQRRVLRTAEERLAWLNRKAEQAGFSILSVNEFEKIHQVGKHKSSQTSPMYMGGYHYEGILRVEDEMKFHNAVMHGIGPGKAYGFGMLLLS